ncbi:MAG: creatininase family protein [Candidatus Methanomethylophilaceae archaeon]|jgi:creatinine amidohydrolase|nr:creatininase family protein [Candidatus Methanomethylophilaceae archaeon]NCA73281.1 creatininase family protein [Gammaproteobacteria bacterium]MDD3350931.1 creatininase family protein [Candidatus Methanomethylophilaceae archaeon]MDD3986581.1 creatininase family protein [Candidatus Methanomethylophilaceae archaeon]MDD4708517.1 creatininase family protein [Candidatus Methanomethylophilaceae archaeon]
MKVAEITRDMFAEAVKKNPVAVFVIGATEAHGPHLPLNSDTVQPMWVAEELDRRFDNLLVLPPMNFGVHSSTRNMPGTVAISFDTMRSVTYDVLTSLFEKGVRKFLVMTGHAGSAHMTACSEACKRFVKETGSKVIFLTDYDVAEEHPSVRGIKGDGHAGLLETSRVMAVCPELVGKERPIGLYSDHGFLVLANAEVCFPEGLAGDTTNASAELGDAVNRYVADKIEEMIRNDLV